MQKPSWTVLVTLLVLTTQTACYTTRAISTPEPEYVTRTNRQWFTAGGFASFSPPAGQQCQNGIARMESKVSRTDWLLSAGLVAAGGLVGALACPFGNDSGTRAACGLGGATLLPLLLASRTVEYRCAASAPGVQRPEYLPPVTSDTVRGKR